MHKLSIITVNLNNLAGLKKTVESVLQQTYQDFEYIIIDGGSTDGSKEFIESVSNRLTYWQSKEDKGIYHAMNQGLQKVQAEYVLFLNSGDYLLNAEVLQVSLNYLDGTELLFGDLLVVDGKNKTVKKYPEKLSFSYLYKESLPHPATFISYDLLINKVGGLDASLNICADWKFFLISICKMDATYKRIDLIISAYNLDGVSSLPTSIDIILAEKQNVIRENFTLFEEDIRDFKNLKAIYQALINSRYINFAIKLKKVLMSGFKNQ